MRTKAVKNKAIMLQLVKKGFELLNVTTDNITKRPCYIFESTEAFQKEFDDLLDNLPKVNRELLTDFEKHFLTEMLKCKRSELNSMGVINTDTIDNIINKLQ